MFDNILDSRKYANNGNKNPDNVIISNAGNGMIALKIIKEDIRINAVEMSPIMTPLTMALECLNLLEINIIRRYGIRIIIKNVGILHLNSNKNPSQ